MSESDRARRWDLDGTVSGWLWLGWFCFVGALKFIAYTRGHRGGHGHDAHHSGHLADDGSSCFSDSDSSNSSWGWSSSFSDSSPFGDHCGGIDCGINPMNGLPMCDGIDVLGNPSGTDFNHF